MKIYIASKTKHAAKWKELRAKGYDVIATWIDEAGEGETKDFADLANRCISEASSANRLILYYESGEYLKGAFIEIGAALANRVPIFVIGEPLPITSTFRNHPLWHQCETLEQALNE